MSGKPTFQKGYNLVLFLDDFMRYYNKGPNYARNAIHHGSISVPCPQEWINANQLYNYVLSHEAVYQFKVLRMEPIFVDEKASQEDHVELDYALVRHFKIQCGNVEDLTKADKDGVNATIIVANQELSKDELKLKYYIIISRNEIFPTSYENARQSGIFKTVMKANLRRLSIEANNIKAETVNYVGYYSKHEQSMEAVIQHQVHTQSF